MNTQQEAIQQILQDAVYAPSGHNFQPWEFKLEDSKIRIFNVPRKDKTIFNYKQRGSLIAIGCLIENIVLSAAEHNYQIDVKIYEKATPKNETAVVTFQEQNPGQRNPLYPYIKLRTTNRKPYKTISLQNDHREKLLQVISEGLDEGDIKLIEQRDLIEELANLFSLNDILLFQNYHIHQSIFPHIRWEKKQELENPGLYIKTLELPPPIQTAFRLFRHWRIARFLHTIGFSKIAAKQNARLYASCSAMGILLARGWSDADFIEAGRLFQKFWLSAQYLSLSLHPITALIHLGERIREGHTSSFNQAEIAVITSAYKRIQEIFGAQNKVMALTFRIGYGKPPSARSSRIPPMIKV